MRNRLGAVILAIASILACALPAHADDYVVRDGAGNPQTFRSKFWSGVHHPLHLFEVLVGGVPTAVTGDGTGAGLDVNVRSSALPISAATAANQTATQATPGSDASKAQAVQGVTGGKPVTAALSSNPPNLVATGTLAVLNDAVSITPAGLQGLGFEVTGTNAGGVITPECQVNAVWQAINVIPLGGGAKASTISASGSYESIAGGVTACRLRLSTAGSGSFGAALVATNGQRLVRAFNTDPSNFYASTTPNNPASGVTPTPCTITTATTCAAPALIPGRDFHVSHNLTGFTGSCQWERQTDGTNWYVVTVTAGGSTTQMYNWSFSAATQKISEDLSEPQYGVSQRLNCTSVSAGTDIVTITQ